VAGWHFVIDDPGQTIGNILPSSLENRPNLSRNFGNKQPICTA